MPSFSLPSVIRLFVICIGALTSTFVHVSNFAHGYDRPAATAGEGRSAVVARHGMVCTSQPLASQAGLDVLKAGGNAVDAALAANAVLGVVEPMSCGIGGDLFVIYWDAKTQKLYGLNAAGRAPQSMTIESYRKRGLDSIPTSGPLSWSVPGCVRGWDDLRAKFGTKSLAEILEPAITYAEEGFGVSPVIGNDWQGAERSLASTPDAAATFLIQENGRRRAPRIGEVMKNPQLAKTYRRLAQYGPDDFYTGETAREFVRYSRQVGGHIAAADLAAHTSEWIEPVGTNYRDYDVWELPPQGQGIAALQMLNVLEKYDLRRYGAGSVEWLHLFTEAKKLAYADRARYYADPKFADVPTARLISKAYADERRKLIGLDKALTDVPHGDEKLVHGDTIYLTVVDKDRNCCSLIQSIYNGFGSQLVAGDLGFAIQNRGALFSLDPQHPNALQPGKRPFHTIIPAMVTRDGKPMFSFGVMGGDMQPQGHVQVLVNLIDFGMNPQAAGDAARIRHSGSADPTGAPADANGGTVHVESGISEEAVAALRKLGHQVVRQRGGYGGYQGILIDWQNGTLVGASESRKDGCAAGW